MPVLSNFWARPACVLLKTLRVLPPFVLRRHHSAQPESIFLHKSHNSNLHASSDLEPAITFSENGMLMHIRRVKADHTTIVPEIHPKDFQHALREERRAWRADRGNTSDATDREELQGERTAFSGTATMGKFSEEDEAHAAQFWELFNTKCGTDDAVHPPFFFMFLGVEQRHGFFITDGGCIGRGLRCVRIGDVLVVVPGGKVPFVLRPFGTRYHLLGESCK